MAQAADKYLHLIDIQTLAGVGPKFANKLYNININNLFDLILHLPLRYLDKTFMPKIADIKQDGNYLVEGKVTAQKTINNNKSTILRVSIDDGSGTIDAVFFNIYHSFIQNFVRGRRVLLFGSVKYDVYNQCYQFVHPEAEFLHNQDQVVLEQFLTPIYPLTDKMPQGSMRKIVKSALTYLEENPIEELLPNKNNPYKLSLQEAILQTHYPKPNADHKELKIEDLDSFKRICFEEIVAYQLVLLSIKRNLLHKQAAIIHYNDNIQQQLLNLLSFKPTNAQLRVFNEITTDLNKAQAMMRLVHGDVGSGKTLVAIMTLAQVATNGAQSVLLAPTELLAIQHFYKINSILSKLNIKVVLLNSSLSKKDKSLVLKDISTGIAQVIIGTHAIFQAGVNYKNLQLAIIDEQHRFGVEQREALLNKAPKDMAMHQIAMTATPIPRTLQLALYSDLDVSIIDELPRGRKPIETAIIHENRKNDVIKRVENICSKGVQVYWVCPLIEESENIDASSAIQIHKLLQEKLPNLNIGLVHGALSSLQKNLVMDRFVKGQINILVATTVIEVGVDVPNASVMIIENADRLGLAQLHQLRGRVGRGGTQSYCLLLHKDVDNNDIARQRLNIMRKTNDGFEIAKQDLILRGPGDIVGTAQSGFNNFKVADVNRDFALVEEARTVAYDLIKTDESLCDRLILRWFSHTMEQNDKFEI